MNFARLIDKGIEKVSTYFGAHRFAARAVAKLQTVERRNTERHREVSRNRLLYPVLTIACISICIWFVSIRIGEFQSFPPEDLYTNPQVYNLTDDGVKWDSYYGNFPSCNETTCDYPTLVANTEPTKSMVLPAREFPLINYKEGQKIFYRTTIEIPERVLKTDEALVFHSFWIWARYFRFYINGRLQDEGGQELINLTIPRADIKADRTVELAFYIDPGNLGNQGIAHRGDLLIGPKSLLMPTYVSGAQAGTTLYLWYLLPKITFCITFCFLFLVFSQNLEFFMFIAFAFLSCLQTFLFTDYAPEMLGSKFDWITLSYVAQIASLIFFMMFIKEFYRLRSRAFSNSFKIIWVTFAIVVTISLTALGKDESFKIITSSAVVINVFAMVFGAYWSFIGMVALSMNGQNRSRARIAAFLFVFFSISIFPTSVEVQKIIAEFLGFAPIHIFNRVDRIVELVFFLVLSGITAIEFGMTQTAKDKIAAELEAVEARLELGRSVQELLLPKERTGHFNQVSYQFFYEPAEQMAGDWLYKWDSEGDQMRLFIGDVVGKGPQAALAVSAIVCTLNECQQKEFNMEETIGTIHHRLNTLFKGRINTTLSAIVINRQHQIDLFNCGAIGWMAFNGQEFSYLPMRGTSLGSGREPVIAKQSINDLSGSTFFTFTDGVLEGSRALKNLQRRLKEQVENITFENLQQIIVDTGSEHVLQDDKTIIMINSSAA